MTKRAEVSFFDETWCVHYYLLLSILEQSVIFFCVCCCCAEDNNTRVLFERVLSSGSLAAEKSRLAAQLLTAYHLLYEMRAR